MTAMVLEKRIVVHITIRKMDHDPWIGSGLATLYYSSAYMKPVHVTQVHSETIDALKRLARSNHRSLQCELRAILERAARMAPPDTAGDEFRLVTVKTGYPGSRSRAQIHGADGR